jgi:Bacterial Ig domain
MDFHPTTGDLYFEDNGIDGLQTRDEPLSADELNRIAAADLGSIVPDFGFPNDYIDYHTGQRVGSGGVQPLAAFLPLPCASCPDPGDPNGADGAESEGPSGIVFAPPTFPSYVNNGVFIGFHGKFSAPPSGNEENPLVFWDLGTGQYFHFIESFQLGHGDQLLATNDSLFIADMASDGNVNTNGGTGVLYQIKLSTAASMTATITSPAESATVSGTVTVGMSETGGTGTITWTLRLDNGGNPIFTTSGTGSTASFSWDTSAVAAGAHQLQLSVQDGAGRTATVTRNVVVQQQPPGTIRVFITQPDSDGTTVSGVVWFTMWLENAAAGNRTLTLSVDGTTADSATTTSNGPLSMAWNSAGASGGTHTATVSVRDSANNTGSANRTVVTAGGPVLTAAFTSPADGATVNGMVAVGMSETNGTGTITWTLRLDGGSTPIFTTSGTATTASFNWNTSGLAAGAHQLQLTVQDGGGRTATATRNITVAAPSLTASITAPTEGAMVNGTVVVGMSASGGTGTITWTVRLDGGSTPIFTTSGTAATASFNWDTSTVSAGAHQLQLSVQDGGGRTATATRNVTVQQQQQATIRVFITQPGTDGTTVSGTVWFTIWLENAAAGTRNLTLSIDGTAVATTSTTSNGPISIPGNSTGTAGGTHTATVSLRDSINNTGSANRTVVIAGGPPTLVASFTSPAEGVSVSGNVTIGMSATGASGTPISFTLTVDGGAPIFSTSGTATTASFGWNANSVSPGAHTLNLTVQDAAGRTATAARHVTVVVSGPPGVQFTSPLEGATVSGTITVAASLSGGTAPFTWTVKVDNTTQIFTSSGSATSISFAWNTTTVADGAHTLNLSVQDSTGASAAAVRNITVQQPPPSTIKVFITQPNTDGTTVSGTTWFVVWLENAAAGNRTVTMSVGGSAVATTTTTSNGPISIPWATSGTADGTQSVTVSVSDSAGGRGSAVRVVNVAN